MEYVVIGYSRHNNIENVESEQRWRMNEIADRIYKDVFEKSNTIESLNIIIENGIWNETKENIILFTLIFDNKSALQLRYDELEKIEFDTLKNNLLDYVNKKFQ